MTLVKSFTMPESAEENSENQTRGLGTVKFVSLLFYLLAISKVI